MLTLLAHLSLDILDVDVFRAFYVAGLGAVEDPTCSDASVLVINAGASQLRMRCGAVAQVWRGHIEMWTREALPRVCQRLTEQCRQVIMPMIEARQLDWTGSVELPELLDDLNGQRLLCHCPHGNTLLVRRVPPSYYIYAHGSHPGGIGGLVALTRLVHIVRPGTAAPLQAFWSHVLMASRCELVERPPVGDGPPTAHAMVRFSSGQQLIFDERVPVAGSNEAALAPDAHDSDAAYAYHICVYLDSVDAFRTTFDACERAAVVFANPALDASPPEEGNARCWAEAEAAGQFRIKDMLTALPDDDEQPVNPDGSRPVALVLEVAVRSVAHRNCPLPRADIVAGGAQVEPPAAFAGCSPLIPPPHSKPGMIRIPHGRGGFGEAARALAREKAAREKAASQPSNGNAFSSPAAARYR